MLIVSAEALCYPTCISNTPIRRMGYEGKGNGANYTLAQATVSDTPSAVVDTLAWVLPVGTLLV